MEEEVINVQPTDTDKARAKELVRKNHKKGLDVEKAEECGLFTRISFLVCAATTLYHVANKIGGDIDNLFQIAGANRHEVKTEIEKYNTAFQKYLQFFKGFQTKDGFREMNEEAETLYHQYMRWCQLPEEWSLGKPQMVESETEPLIRIDTEDRELRFFHTILESEDLTEDVIKYCVTKYDPQTRTQETIETEGLDKSTVAMVAKRYSANDNKNIYTASRLVTKEQKVTEIFPLKAYQDNNLIGSYRSVFKKV